MTSLISLHNSLFQRLGADTLVPTLARLVFVAVLFVYYWNAAGLKFDGSIFSASAGAFGQIFPKAAEAALYDVSQLSVFQRLVIFAGTIAEYVLPVLIAVGLLTRLAALGAIGMIVVQTAVDVAGHGVKLGGLFDTSIGLIDERTMWIFVLVVLILRGAGAVSLDRLFKIA